MITVLYALAGIIAVAFGAFALLVHAIMYSITNYSNREHSIPHFISECAKFYTSLVKRAFRYMLEDQDRDEEVSERRKRAEKDQSGEKISAYRLFEYVRRTYIDANPTNDHENEGALAERIYLLAYLAEWYSAIHHETSLTNARWGNMGQPVSEDYAECVRHAKESSPLKRILATTRVSSDERDSIPQRVASCVGHVLDATAQMTEIDLSAFVQSTYPIQSSNFGMRFDMDGQAQKYKFAKGIRTASSF